MNQFLSRFVQDESGATAIEYGLIAALISITIIAAAQSIGGSVKDRFDKVNNCVKASTSAELTAAGC